MTSVLGCDTFKHDLSIRKKKCRHGSGEVFSRKGKIHLCSVEQKGCIYAHCSNVEAAKAHTALHRMTHSQPESELVFEAAFLLTQGVSPRLSSSGDGIWWMWSASLHLAKRSIHMCCLNMSNAIPSMGKKRGKVLVSPSAVAMILRMHNMLPVLWDRHVEFMPWEGVFHLKSADRTGLAVLFSLSVAVFTGAETCPNPPSHFQYA